MPFSITAIRLHVLPMRTRFPFKYGIASMSALPHLLMQVDLVVDGREVRGTACEGLPPKWFTKDPTTLFETDLAAMLAVIQNSVRVAKNAAERPVLFRDFWRALYDEQHLWASHTSTPPLLTNLGVSLIERAVLDALCRAAALPLHILLRRNLLGLDLGSVRPVLKGIAPADFIAAQPLPRLHLRHTVGLGDPLRACDIPQDEQIHDGLPHALDESIRAYGLRYFKLKFCGQIAVDLPRMRAITAVLTEHCTGPFYCTFDGNEQFHDMASFRAFYEELCAEPALAPFFASLLLVEQPLHRAHALDDSVGSALAAWRDAPTMIIDESDGSLDDLPRALALGYSGTSHKNCKGIVKGLANAALLYQQRQQQPGKLYALSGEDLASVGPVAMLQDLAMVALLGISHVERNGHHYFRGLSSWPEKVQRGMLLMHDDLYEARPNAGAAAYPSLRVHEGQIEIGSVNEAPFGCAVPLELAEFEPLNEWIKGGGMGLL